MATICLAHNFYEGLLSEDAEAIDQINMFARNNEDYLYLVSSCVPQHFTLVDCLHDIALADRDADSRPLNERLVNVSINSKKLIDTLEEALAIISTDKPLQAENTLGNRIQEDH